MDNRILLMTNYNRLYHETDKPQRISCVLNSNSLLLYLLFPFLQSKTVSK